MQISKRIDSLAESQTLQIAARCQQLRAEGVDVIGLSLGEPDFPAPARGCIKEILYVCIR